MDQYYRVNIQKMTFRELCRHSNFAIAGIVWLLSKFKLIDLSDKTLHKFPSFDELEVPEQELSEEARNQMAAPLKEFTELDFRPVTFQRLRNPLDPKNVDNGAVFLLHSTGEYVGTVMYLKKLNQDISTEVVALFVYSVLAPDRRFAVTNQRAYLNPCERSETVFKMTSRPGDLLKCLEKRVASLRHRYAPQIINDVKCLRKYYDNFQSEEIRERVARGIYEAASAEQVQGAVEELHASAPPA